ncbi:ATPase, T2SS/T4P/T4SS family [Serratia liquefaciens]|uniref:ATPase, T2SS/T4P/T4SS family n=1 Tax=Serratia liquefaciens TaxID=614 RepID=UPI00215848D8|nr:ATPase, T2SS/T4P/T4SS family [Serratia liquefaciens]
MSTAISDEIHTLCQRYQALALSEDDQCLNVALTTEAPQALLSALRFATGKRIHLEQWPAARLELELNRRQMQGDRHEQPTSEEQFDAASLNDDSDAPVVQFINQTLRIAIQRRASDIHFEPYQQTLRIRLRIDGVLQVITSPPFTLAARLTARLKIMVQFSSALSCPQGMILVTGPTGSGKTVTLYSGLRQLNDAQSNLCSVEDPIEIPLFGINQTQTNAKTELDFSRVLRALLRQDPDVIMIGEIRDRETAEIAVKAAQTGHLVLSTLHANSTSETLTRLTHMGIPGYLIAACLKLVIAQRLVRKLCSHCRYQQSQPVRFPAAIWATPLLPWKADGCEHCFSGYYGRTGVYELLTITPEVQAGLLEGAAPSMLAEIARQQGQTTLLQAGLTLVAQGVTSLEEVYRIVGVIADGGVAQ